jgi:hypothetical protein
MHPSLGEQQLKAKPTKGILNLIENQKKQKANPNAYPI